MQSLLQVGAHGATWALTINKARVSQLIDGLAGGKGNGKVIIARFDKAKSNLFTESGAVFNG